MLEFLSGGLRWRPCQEEQAGGDPSHRQEQTAELKSHLKNSSRELEEDLKQINDIAMILAVRYIVFIYHFCWHQSFFKWTKKASCALTVTSLMVKAQESLMSVCYDQAFL